MRIFHLFLFVIMLILLSCDSQKTKPKTLLIAVAANLHDTMSEVVKAFERQSHIKVQIVFGSSGNLYTQIIQGAPYNIFFAADTDFPQALYQQKKTSKPVVYCRGKLALWWNKEFLKENIEWSMLTNKNIHKIAIANYEHAPYGKRAKEALGYYKVWDKIQSKIILGKNIAQTTLFAQTGNAQVAIISLSMALSPGIKDLGGYKTIDSQSHLPLEQAYTVIDTNEQVKKFLAFFHTQEAKTIFTNYGYEIP